MWPFSLAARIHEANDNAVNILPESRLEIPAGWNGFIRQDRIYMIII